MTFAEELQHALTHLPVMDALDPPHKDAAPEEWEKFYESRRPKVCEPVDNMGEEVRILSLEEAVPVFVELMRARDEFNSEVWAEIWDHRAKMRRQREAAGMPYAPHHVLKPETEEEQVRLHLSVKCPNPEERAFWAVYRDGKPAHIRALDRQPYDHQEVWVQWIVGTKAVGRPSLRVAQVLYDVGVRRICWAALPNHPLNAGHWDKFKKGFKRVVPENPNQQGFKSYGNGLLHGCAQEWCVELTERPETYEDWR